MGGVVEKCCTPSVPPVEGTLPEPPARKGLPSKDKMRPLVTDLEADFNEFCGDDGRLDALELAKVWLKCARRKFGSLTEEDEATIKQAATVFQDQLDLDKSGDVSFEELAVFMLGGTEERGPLRGMQEQLQKHKINISDMLAKFRKWDTSGDGYLSKDELRQHASDLQELCGGKPPKGGPEMLVERILQEADIDNDGMIDLYELLAHSLGRRKQSVELILYDISNGASKRYSSVLLGRRFEAIYHSSVYVFNKEFWYGGTLFQTEPPSTKVFGPPLKESSVGLTASKYDPSLMVVHLGFTLATRNEFLEFLVDKMKPKYRRDNYDVFTNNCNSFTNEVVRYLTGADIPVEIRNLPALVMQTPTAKLLRPVLNKWLGGFGGGADGGAKDVDVITPIQEEDADTVIQELFGAGSLVTFEGNVATILHDHGDTADIKFYDPSVVQFVERAGIPKGELKKPAKLSSE